MSSSSLASRLPQAEPLLLLLLLLLLGVAPASAVSL
jgi:hypothetical protein